MWIIRKMPVILLGLVFQFCSCSAIQGGIEGEKALKEIEEARLSGSSLQLTALMDSISSASSAPEPADCVPVDSRSSNVPDSYYPENLMNPRSLDITRKVLNIEKGRMYTKESVDDCVDRFNMLYPVFAKKNLDLMNPYILNQCQIPRVLVYPVDVIIAMICDIEEASLFRMKRGFSWEFRDIHFFYYQ